MNKKAVVIGIILAVVMSAGVAVAGENLCRPNYGTIWTILGEFGYGDEIESGVVFTGVQGDSLLLEKEGRVLHIAPYHVGTYANQTFIGSYYYFYHDCGFYSAVYYKTGYIRVSVQR